MDTRLAFFVLDILGRCGVKGAGFGRMPKARPLKTPHRLSQQAICASIESMKWFIFLIVVILSVSASYVPTAAANDDKVYIATVSGEITAGSVQYIERVLKQASQANADLFLLELNTQGGLLKATEDISRALVEATVPTAVYVYKDTGFALSAGVFILLSSDIAAAHPNAVIGAATPVTGEGGDAAEKIVNASAEWLSVLATRNDRPVEEIKDFVFTATTVSGERAYQEGVVDELATSTEQLLEILGHEGAVVTRLAPNWIDNLMSLLSLPFLVPLLISLGVIGIFFMLRTGDVESAGIFGVVFLLLGLWGMGSITVSTLGLLMLALGLAFLVIEFTFSPGFGVVGLAGVVTLIFGTITFANEPFFPNYLDSPLFYGVAGSWLALAGIMVLLGKFSADTLRKPVLVGSEAWYGKTVMLENDLNPQGRITLEGDSYIARAVDGSTLQAGNRVTIVKIEGNTILVMSAKD